MNLPSTFDNTTTMEMKLTISLAIITTLLMHHLSLTAATIAHHTTKPTNDSLAGFSLQLVAAEPEGLDHTVRRGSDGFLHLQSLRTDQPPHPSSGANSSAANVTALRSEMYTPLRVPRQLVVGVGTGNGHHNYLFKVFDSTSDLIWMQCTGCDPHSPQRHPLFDPRASPTFHFVLGTDRFCQPPFWSELSGHACAFRATGPRDMLVEGYLGHEQLTYEGAVHHNVPFGCAHKAQHFQNDGVFAGLIGAQALGRGMTRFSYCLFHSGETNRRGLLRFGTDVPSNPRYRTTKILPVLDAHEPSGHYVDLVGVSLGACRLYGIWPEMFARRKDDGQGGCVIDLGMPLTVMAKEAYDIVEEAVWSDLRRHGAERVRRPGYGLCVRASKAIKGRLQSLSLHFSEEEAVLVVLPEQLFLMMDDEQGRIVCLAMTPGRRTVIGALQQVDTRFVFDLKDSKVSFAPESCIRDTVEGV